MGGGEGSGSCVAPTLEREDPPCAWLAVRRLRAYVLTPSRAGGNCCDKARTTAHTDISAFHSCDSDQLLSASMPLASAALASSSLPYSRSLTVNGAA